MATQEGVKKGFHIEIPYKLKRMFKRTRIMKALWSFIHGVLVIGICFIILYPIFVKFSVAFRAEKDLYDSTVIYIPRNFSMETMQQVWEEMNYIPVFLNTTMLCFIVSICQVISCTLVGYGFARFKFPGKNILFFCVILTLVVPPQTIYLPTFLHFKQFDILGIVKLFNGGNTVNLLDKFTPFALLSITCQGFKNGLYIYMLRQFFRNMPGELEEAAYVDGAGFFKTFYTIMLPSAFSMIVTIFLFSFVWQWTDTHYTSLFLTKTEVLSSKLSTLAMNLQHKKSGALVAAGIIVSPAYMSQVNNAGSILVMVPLIVIYLFCQRFFVQSIERSGIVG